MSNTIAQNLQRLQTTRTNITNAITNKGVTVPSGSGFEDFAGLIDSISASENLITGSIVGSGYTMMNANAYRFGRLIAVNFSGLISSNLSLKSIASNTSLQGLNLPSSKPSGTVESVNAVYYDASGEYTATANFTYQWAAGNYYSNSNKSAKSGEIFSFSHIIVLPE